METFTALLPMPHPATLPYSPSSAGPGSLFSCILWPLALPLTEEEEGGARFSEQLVHLLQCPVLLWSLCPPPLLPFSLTGVLTSTARPMVLPTCLLPRSLAGGGQCLGQAASPVHSQLCLWREFGLGLGLLVEALNNPSSMTAGWEGWGQAQ